MFPPQRNEVTARVRLRLFRGILRQDLAIPIAPSQDSAAPRHPRDLADHECINWHATADAPPYRWEFTESGRDFSVSVPTRVLSNDPGLILRLARAGVGLTIVYEDQVRDDLARGDLVPVLEDFSTPFRAITCTFRAGATPLPHCVR